LSVLLLVICLTSSLTLVRPDEIGVRFRFGAIVEDHLAPGLHLTFPWPIEKIVTVNAHRVYRVEVGFRTDPILLRNVSAMLWETRHYKVQGYQKIEEESIAVSGDEYIVDFSIVVHYRPKDAVVHLFHVNQIHEVVRGLAECCMREVLATEKSARLMTDQRSRVLRRVKEKMSHRVDRLGLGVEILAVYYHDVHPPLLTLAKFRDVFSAREDREKYLRQAEAHRNQELPRARAERETRLADALAFEMEQRLHAEGDAEKFLLTAQAYQEAPDVTGHRLFLESIEEALAGREKIIANPEANVGGYTLWMYTPSAEDRKRATGL
jgi:membrane protease subunit HflK